MTTWDVKEWLSDPSAVEKFMKERESLTVITAEQAKKFNETDSLAQAYINMNKEDPAVLANRQAEIDKYFKEPDFGSIVVDQLVNKNED